MFPNTLGSPNFTLVNNLLGLTINNETVNVKIEEGKYSLRIVIFKFFHLHMQFLKIVLLRGGTNKTAI